ncbi:MAG TPA: CRISPR-associated helicase Cas3' [Deltaproteobacteria bacterium]|nr:CRISPR-associated helicase Cas3' [Deltaproteobacteria bacterium]
MNIKYAHTPSKNSPNQWHTLNDHIIETAKLAYTFSKAFGSENLGFILGIFHDLGKVNPLFQDYLQSCSSGKKPIRVPHSVCGASYLWKILLRQNPKTACLAMCAMGHQGGLISEHEAVTEGGTLDQWWNGAQNNQIKSLMQEFLQCLPLRRPEPIPEDDLRRELRLRMLFSALVDADFLDTENHFDKIKTAYRGHWTRPADLWPIFRTDQLRMMWNGSKSEINRIRKQIYFTCVRAGKQSPGVFRLTVPTGGGKTRSGLAFALSHAIANKRHGFRRIIIALPYTSIIDQNARVYQNILGDHFVLEHHSQVDIPEDESQSEASLRHRLASENWDFPLIVTTTVQLLESLFSNKPCRCRKLHNIARSIIILDEVQTLPPELLEPTMDILRALVDEYGVTLVLSTATQPAFDQTPYIKAFEGIGIQEIINTYQMHFKKLERVEYQPVQQYNTLAELVDELAKPENAQVLVILNTRKHALDLHEKLKQYGVDGLYHLSTLLCGAHRKRVLREVTERLGSNDGLPVRLISTQVVEAGVDLDFPVVYRAMGPLDRIVQAAGRCNREAKRPEKGKVIIFDFPDNASPPGSYKTGMDDAKTLLGRNPSARLHDPDLYTEYFQMLFRDVDLDKKCVQPYRRDLNYPKVAEKYKLIEDTIPVVITTYDNNEGERRLQEYIRKPSREAWRRLIPYVVNLSHRDLHREEIKECITEASSEHHSNLFRWIGAYDQKTHRGIQGIVRDPSDLYVGD